MIVTVLNRNCSEAYIMYCGRDLARATTIFIDGLLDEMYDPDMYDEARKERVVENAKRDIELRNHADNFGYELQIWNE